MNYPPTRQQPAVVTEPALKRLKASANDDTRFEASTSSTTASPTARLTKADLRWLK